VPAGAVAAPPARGGRRLRGQPKTAAAPLTASERAVKVDDRFSGWYVIAVVAVFALIFANAVLFGHGGFVGGLFPTPTPTVAPTAAPTASPAPTSAAPSVSASPASPSASASPAASPSTAPSVSAAPSSAPASAAPTSS
jgi:cytoskeletal protein RodZ